MYYDFYQRIEITSTEILKKRERFRASPRVFKTISQSMIFGKIENTHISNSSQSFGAWKNRRRRTDKYARVSIASI